MKITIESGTTYTEALEILKNFLDKNYAEYPILEKKMNIYFYLNGKAGQICPDNKQEYLISKQGVTDVKQVEMIEAVEETKTEIGNRISSLERQLFSINRYIRLDESYLSTAESKGRKPENIEKRKEELNKHYKERQDHQELLRIYSCVYNAVKEKNYKGRAEIHTINRYGRKQRIYEVFLDFDLPEFYGTYSIMKGLQRRNRE